MTAQIAIVPAYNEAASISAVVAELGEHAPGFDVVVIDDGSTDDTAERARAAGADVVRHPFNLGIGGAVQSGYLYAAERGYDIAVQVDGDGQHDPRAAHVPPPGHRSVRPRLSARLPRGRGRAADARPRAEQRRAAGDDA